LNVLYRIWEGRVGVSLGRNEERGREREGEDTRGFRIYPASSVSWAGKTAKFKFLLQTLEFAVWDVDLVGGDGC
jgi:hypothetical protein